MNAKSQPASRSLPVLASHWAAGPLAYTAVMVVLAKLGRAGELALRLDSARPFLLVPAVLGQDLVLVAAVGLIGHGLGRLRRPRLRVALTLLLLAPIALLLPADVVAHLLTGKPITFQRLRGDEGATLGDLGLIDTADLIGGCVAIAVALGGLWPALRYAPRVRWLRGLCRPRALLVTLLAGVAAGLVQGALLPHTQGLSEQPVFVLLQSLTDRGVLTGMALSDRRWRALHEPGVKTSVPPAPRVGGPAPRNVVIFLAEGIPFESTGFNPDFGGKLVDRKGRPLPNPTPYLTARHARHGLVFDRYYANWHASIQAIFSIVCSAFPPLGGDIVRIKPRIDCGEMSEILADHGIRAGLFHGGRFNFYNKLALLGRRGYRIELDAEELAKKSARSTHQWGIDDRAVADAVLGWVDTLPRDQRFAALIIPITAHYPYWTPRDFKRPFKGNSRRERFLNAVAFQDQVFEEMLRGFEQRGRYDDTLFVWLGDHGHYVSEPERLTPGLREFYEPNLHTPLVLINPRMFPPTLPARERVSPRLGGHVDLVPTLLAALGVEDDDPRHQGQDLLGRGFRPRRVFFGAEDGKFLGFLEGSYKFAVETRSKRTEYYDLAKDPDELVDLSARYAERMRRYTEDAIAFARGAQARIDAAPVLPEAVSVTNIYELFRDHVGVTWEHDGQRVSCGSGAQASCPDLGEMLRIKTQRMQGEKRRCVLVKVPPAGKLELRIAERDALDLLTGTIVALPGMPAGDPRFEIGAAVDGTEYPKVLLTVRGAMRPSHPRATRELRFTFQRLGEPASEPPEVCLQLTTLFSQ